MKNSVNKVILLGNTTRDIELKQAGGGVVCEVGLALNETISTKNGFKDEVTFVDVTLWGKTAEWAAKEVKKGTLVYVEGKMRMDEWVDAATKQKRRKMRILADNFKKLASPRPVNPAQSTTNPNSNEPPNLSTLNSQGDEYVEF